MTTQNLVPLWQTPIADPQSGLATQSWFEFFARLTAKPGPIVPVQVTASPFTYTASVNGQLAVSGGTVSAITFARARVVGVNVGLTSGLVPMSQGDIVTITYSGAPTVWFIPS